MQEQDSNALAITFSRPKIKAAAPAAAEYSRASPGAPCEVSAPTATPYLMSPVFTRFNTTYIPSVPALQANSKSAVWTSGVAPRASAKTVPLGLTAQGWDSEPIYTAPISLGLIRHLFIAFLAASTDMVMVSWSGEGTDFSSSINPLLQLGASAPQTLAISSTLILFRGMYAPYPTIPSIYILRFWV